jgi:hypothetical protein
VTKTLIIQKSTKVKFTCTSTVHACLSQITVAVAEIGKKISADDDLSLSLRKLLSLYILSGKCQNLSRNYLQNTPVCEDGFSQPEIVPTLLEINRKKLFFYY